MRMLFIIFYSLNRNLYVIKLMRRFVGESSPSPDIRFLLGVQHESQTGFESVKEST